MPLEIFEVNFECGGLAQTGGLERALSSTAPLFVAGTWKPACFGGSKSTFCGRGPGRLYFDL